ncbi:MAG TPA: glycosyltransferase [Oculatellaceae cyanobacterium]|jgi:hypothetical protein
MRILLSCQQATRKHPVPAYDFWENYLKKGIEEAGHEWVEVPGVDWAEGLVYLEDSDREALKAWRDRTWNQTVSYIKQQHQNKQFDFFLSYLFPKQVEPTAVEEIKSLGIPCVNFFCDNVREFKRVAKEFYCFDLHWVPEFKALPMYKQAKLNYIFAPMPLWIPTHQRTCEHSENYGVSFIGSRDVQREALFAQVIKYGLNVEIRGAAWSSSDSVINNVKSAKSLGTTVLNQWRFFNKMGFQPFIRKITEKYQPKIAPNTFDKYVREKPNAEKYVEITQQSIITLGVNRYPSYRYPFNKPDTYSRLRDLEAPMMGACYLTEWTEGLDQLYELGEEIETYRTAQEMVEKIQQLKVDSDQRKKMRCQGQKRALAEHTIPQSLAKITNYLGIK